MGQHLVELAAEGDQRLAVGPGLLILQGRVVTHVLLGVHAEQVAPHAEGLAQGI